MENQTHLAKDDVQDAVLSGQRSAAAHNVFSSDVVQLAFGKTDEGRIVHVTDVERGLSSTTFCPACSERLIARQGKRKAWHFAHANGHACRDALSAALASWLSQCLSEGREITIPALSVPWGKTSFPDQSERKIVAETATYGRVSEQGPFEVRAGFEGGDHQLRILFRTSTSSQYPSIETLAEQGHSAISIDIYTPLMERITHTSNDTIDLDWLTTQMLCNAPRDWLWSQRATLKRDMLCRQRLGRHINAFHDLSLISGGGAGDTPTSSENLLERHGLLHLAQTPAIEGERFLGPWPQAWRAAIVAELILQPFAGGLRDVILRDAAFGRRKIVAAIARQRIVMLPDVFKPLPSDDEIELRKIIPDLRRPLDVVEDYLAHLANLGALSASPRKSFRHKLNESCTDDRLNAIQDADWVASPKITQHAMRVAAAEALLR